MFEPTSRYAELDVAELETIDAAGERRPVRYARRRFIAPPPPSSALVAHRVVEGDRLDRLAARYLGDPTQFWRICDANGVLRPDELTATPGERIEIPQPGGP